MFEQTTHINHGIMIQAASGSIVVVVVVDIKKSPNQVSRTDDTSKEDDFDGPT